MMLPLDRNAYNINFPLHVRAQPTKITNPIKRQTQFAILKTDVSLEALRLGIIINAVNHHINKLLLQHKLFLTPIWLKGDDTVKAEEFCNQEGKRGAT